MLRTALRSGISHPDYFLLHRKVSQRDMEKHLSFYAGRLWGQCCGTVSEGAACSASIRYASPLVHLPSRSLGRQWRTAQVLGPLHARGRPGHCDRAGNGSAMESFSPLFLLLPVTLPLRASVYLFLRGVCFLRQSLRAWDGTVSGRFLCMCVVLVFPALHQHPVGQEILSSHPTAFQCILKPSSIPQNPATRFNWCNA